MTDPTPEPVGPARVVALAREFVEDCREDLESQREIPEPLCREYLEYMYEKFKGALSTLDLDQTAVFYESHKPGRAG